MLKRGVKRVIRSKKSDEKRVLEDCAVQRQNDWFSGARSECSFDSSFSSIEESSNIVFASVEWSSWRDYDTLAIHYDQIDRAGEALVKIDVIVDLREALSNLNLVRLALKVCHKHKHI